MRWPRLKRTQTFIPEAHGLIMQTSCNNAGHWAYRVLADGAPLHQSRHCYATEEVAQMHGQTEIDRMVGQHLAIDWRQPGLDTA